MVRTGIRVVRLMDHGLVEPEKRGGAWVMQPMVRLVATALDRDKPDILRFEEKTDTNPMATVVAGAQNGGRELVPRRDDLKAILLDEGFQVKDGEWTPRVAESFLNVRTKALG